MRTMAPTMSRQDSRARAEEAYRLRAVGRTYGEIAIALGYGSAGAVHTAIARLHKRAPATSPDAARRSASEGLRVMRSMLFEQAVDAKNRGDTDDLVLLGKEIRQNIAEDAKLHGAHAPVRSQVDVTVHQDATAIIDRMESELLALSARQPQPQRVLDAVIEGEVIEGEVIEP